MAELDGLCSLRLREPCLWEGAKYDAVGPVSAVPVMSVLSANETAEAEELVREVLEAAQGLLSPSPSPSLVASPAPSPSYGDGNYPGGCLLLSTRLPACCGDAGRAGSDRGFWAGFSVSAQV